MTAERSVPPSNLCRTLTCVPAGVRLAPLRCDSESLRLADALAEAVRAELMSLDDEDTLDAFMKRLRGRRWSPWPGISKHGEWNSPADNTKAPQGLADSQIISAAAEAALYF